MKAGLIRPAPVRPGATVAVVSPCSPVVFWWEHRAAQARSYLESLGLQIRVMPHSGQAMAGTQVSPRSRAEDLLRLGDDPRGVAEGQLVAGCLETICRHLKGSPVWLDLQGALLVLETSEEVPPPHQVDAYLAELADAAVFEQITGLVVARPYGYDQDRTLRFWSLVASRTEASGVPVLGNVECGHADPMLTLPLGIRARIDATARSFETLEPALRPR